MNSQNKMVYMQKILNPSSHRSSETSKESLANIMIDSINKAIDPAEVPIKEKHVRRLIIGTFEAESGNFFWQYLPIVRLKENQIVCWKFCYILHKLIRDGHKQALVSSQNRRQIIADCRDLWTHVEGYGPLIARYCALLYNRITFLSQYPNFSRDLKLSDTQLDEVISSQGIGFYYGFCCEIFDAWEDLLIVQEAVLKVVEDRCLNSMTKVGQCHLYPLVACIQESSLFYDYSVKCLFKCYSHLKPSSMEGHRIRFSQLHAKLRSVYQRESKLQYFKTLIQIPLLPEEPPNFRISASLKQHTTPKVILFSETSERESPDEMLVNLDESDLQSNSSSSTTTNHQPGDSLVQVVRPLADAVGLPPSAARDESSLSADNSLIDASDGPSSPQSEVIQRMNERIGNYEQSTRELGKELAELLAKIKLLTGELEDEKLHHSKTKDDYEKTRRDASNLKHQLAAAKNDFNRLKEEYERAKHDSEISQEAMKKLMKDLNDLRGKRAQEAQSSSLLALEQQKQAAQLERELAEKRRLEEEEEEREQRRKVEQNKLEEDSLAADMNSVEQIIREASRKIEELAEKSRQVEQDGIKLQVNEKISEVCTNLMVAVKHLFGQSRILQRDIVAQENGKSVSAGEFYRRDSRWTDGLVSGAREVATAAKNLVDVADRSLSGASKFTELAAAAHEIATATTQLLVASQVKVNKDNKKSAEKLKNVSVAARQVRECTTNVVEACRVCANLLGKSGDGTKDVLDLSSLSLHQTKQKEIESQIKILELEAELARERTRLGFLRRQHYEQEEAAEAAQPQRASSNGVEDL